MTAPIPDPAEHPLLTFEEGRQIYGVSRTSFYPMLQRGEVPGAFRCGALWRIRTAELRRALLGVSAEHDPDTAA